MLFTPRRATLFGFMTGLGLCALAIAPARADEPTAARYHRPLLTTMGDTPTNDTSRTGKRRIRRGSPVAPTGGRARNPEPAR